MRQLFKILAIPFSSNSTQFIFSSHLDSTFASNIQAQISEKLSLAVSSGLHIKKASKVFQILSTDVPLLLQDSELDPQTKVLILNKLPVVTDK